MALRNHQLFLILGINDVNYFSVSTTRIQDALCKSQFCLLMLNVVTFFETSFKIFSIKICCCNSICLVHSILL